MLQLRPSKSLSKLVSKSPAKDSAKTFVALEVISCCTVALASSCPSPWFGSLSRVDDIRRCGKLESTSASTPSVKPPLFTGIPVSVISHCPEPGPGRRCPARSCGLFTEPVQNCRNIICSSRICINCSGKVKRKSTVTDSGSSNSAIGVFCSALRGQVYQLIRHMENLTPYDPFQPSVFVFSASEIYP